MDNESTMKNMIDGGQKKSPPVKMIVFLVVLAVLVSLPFWGGAYIINLVILVLLYTSFGQMWNLLGGYAGLVSLGQQSFIGLGGYALALISQKYGLPIFLAFIVAAVVSVLFALIISIPIFKMSGVYFTIGTWIVAECLALFFSTWAFVNYAQGYNITASYKMPIEVIYFIAFAVGVGSILVVFFILRSKLGLGLMAMRDNISAAEVRGVEIYRTKLKCFLISACITGVAGAAMYLYMGSIRTADGFGISWTISMVFIVIIGGIGTIEGPIIGAIIFVALRQFLFAFPGYSMVILGVIAIIIIMVAPKGIAGMISRKKDLQLFPTRRK